MKIRHATMNDMDEILAIYARARAFMRESGNLTQWQGGYPSREILEEDIARNQLYVMEEEQLEGVFVFFCGIEPTYHFIDGDWLNDLPYGVIHRVASAGRIRGMVSEMVRFCSEISSNLKIDTHEDNRVMQKLVERAGFQRCGIIYLANGDPRIAYQRFSED